MKNTGNNRTAYGKLPEMAESLARGLTPNGTSSNSALIRLSLLLPIIIWCINRVVNLVVPSTSMVWVNLFQLITACLTVYSFVKVSDRLALSFTGLFWLYEFYYFYVAIDGHGWSSYLIEIYRLFIVLYFLTLIYLPRHAKTQVLMKKIRPVFKLIISFLLIVEMIIAVVVFFINITDNYYNLQNLIVLLSSVVMLAFINGVFDRVSFGKSLKFLAPPIALGLILFFSLLDGIISAIVLKDTGISPLLLFIATLAKGILAASFILPAYLMLNCQVKISDIFGQFGGKDGEDGTSGDPREQNQPLPSVSHDVPNMQDEESLSVPNTVDDASVDPYAANQAADHAGYGLNERAAYTPVDEIGRDDVKTQPNPLDDGWHSNYYTWNNNNAPTSEDYAERPLLNRVDEETDKTVGAGQAGGATAVSNQAQGSNPNAASAGFESGLSGNTNTNPNDSELPPSIRRI